MRAVVVREFAPFELATVADVEDPRPAVDEVIIDVGAIEVNFPDLLVMEGKYQLKPPLPFSPGKVAAGRIAAVGDNVSQFAIGTRVCAQVEYGAYAEKLRAPAHSCFVLPKDMTLETGAALGLAYQTAFFALLNRARICVGDTVLVLGASGGIGSASIQLAKAVGASTVIGGARGDAKLQLARDMGCDHVIDLAMDNLRDGLREQVREYTNGRGVDIVIDPVGGDANAAALRALAWCGRLVVIGFAAGGIPTIKANYLLLKNIEVSGLQWSDYRDHKPELVRRAQEKIFTYWREQKMDPCISAVLPMERFVEALSAIREGRTQGRAILTTSN